MGRISWTYNLISKVIGMNLGASLVFITMSSPAFASPLNQLRTCQNAVIGLVGLPLSMVEVSVTKDNDRVVYPNSVTVTIKRPSVVSTLRSNFGKCEFDTLGKLIKIDTLFYSGEAWEFQDFGNFPNLGRFVVIRASTLTVKDGNRRYYILLLSNDGGGNAASKMEIFFPVLLDDRKEWWWTDCETKKIGRLSDNGEKKVLLSSQTGLETKISEFICSS
jgi:hypothetical protein